MPLWGRRNVGDGSAKISVTRVGLEESSETSGEHHQTKKTDDANWIPYRRKYSLEVRDQDHISLSFHSLRCVVPVK